MPRGLTYPVGLCFRAVAKSFDIISSAAEPPPSVTTLEAAACPKETAFATIQVSLHSSLRTAFSL